jgi:hypothetical protein
LIDGVFESDVEYFEDGRRKSLSRKELAVKQHIQKGIRGDLPNIAALLDLRDEAKRSSRAKPKIIVENWMPVLGVCVRMIWRLDLGAMFRCPSLEGLIGVCRWPTRYRR